VRWTGPTRRYSDLVTGVTEDLYGTGNRGRIFLISAGSDAVLVVDAVRIDQGPRNGPRVAWSPILTTIPTQSRPEYLALSGDGKTLVVSNRLSDSLSERGPGRAGASGGRQPPDSGAPSPTARAIRGLTPPARPTLTACQAAPAAYSDGSWWRHTRRPRTRSAFRRLQEFGPMGMQCAVCGKKPAKGNQKTYRGKAKYLGGIGKKITGISKRTFYPNLQRIQVVHEGAVTRKRVCVACIRSGRVQRPVKRKLFQTPSFA
jgi:large subunit ribosomal protein L28